MTPSGLKPATFRLAAQCLHYCPIDCPHICIIIFFFRIVFPNFGYAFDRLDVFAVLRNGQVLWIVADSGDEQWLTKNQA
jgi:hypothetical protein